MDEVKKRKRRSDRNHILYEVLNTVTGEKYVGLAVCVDRTGVKTLKDRWTRHVGRALLHDKKWRLCESIRTHGPEAFEPRVLYKVRSKQLAFSIETQLRKSGEYALNTA